MKYNVSFDSIYKQSEDIVSREIQGEIVIVPITSGIGDLEDDLFTLNETGRVIWGKLDGKEKLKKIAKSLALDFNIPFEDIKKDISGFVKELLKRRMLVEVK